jgi:DNA-binding XRE family transcriptional regulator
MGTQGENIRDAVQKGRMLVGEMNGGTKFTKDQILEIRRIYAEGGITHETLSRQFGVTRECITAIMNGKNWAHTSNGLATKTSGPEDWHSHGNAGLAVDLI